MAKKLILGAILVFSSDFVSAVSLRANSASTFDANDAMNVMNFFGATDTLDIDTQKRSTPFLLQRDDRDLMRGRGKNAEAVLIQDDRGLMRGRGKNAEAVLIQDDRGLMRGRGKDAVLIQDDRGLMRGRGKDAVLIQDDRGLMRGRGKNAQM